MKKTLCLVAAAGVLALASVQAWPVIAAEDSRDTDDSGSAAGPWLPESTIEQKLEELGYAVREIEREDGVYEVAVTDANGLPLEAYVDPHSGEIVDDPDD